jgi:hypothetical protein
MSRVLSILTAGLLAGFTTSPANAGGEASDGQSAKTPSPNTSAAPTTAKSKPAKNRTWVDITGKHRTIAKLLEVTEDRVRLLKMNGKTVSLPLDQLSEADRQFVQEWLASANLPATESSASTASDDKPAATDKDAASGPPKKGRSWLNVNEVDVNGDKRRPGKRFTIWPTTDEPLKIENGQITLKLHWEVTAAGMPPGEPKHDGIQLSVFIVNKTARLFLGKSARLETGAAKGEVERTESLNVDLQSADVYAYFGHDEIDPVKLKVVSIPLSNIIRIKAGRK